jgi:hypothetical protein
MRLLTMLGPQSSFDRWTVILVAPECWDMARYARLYHGLDCYEIHTKTERGA